MNSLAENYRKAEEIIFARFTTEKDRLGRSQLWKIHAITEDRLKNKNTSLLETFLGEVESIVNQLEKGVVISIPSTTITTSTKPENEGLEIKDVIAHGNGA